MAGTAKSYDSTKIVIGPADLWVKVAVPAASGRLTLFTDLTPDATANPSCYHAGMTKDGCEVTYKPTVAKFECDELTAPYFTRLITESLSIKGTLLQFNWAKIIADATVGGTYSTSTGYEQVIMGGLSSVSTYSVALIGPESNDATKAWVVQLYKTYNDDGWVTKTSRKAPSELPITFPALAVSTRATGDQIGNFWQQI